MVGLRDPPSQNSYHQHQETDRLRLIQRHQDGHRSRLRPDGQDLHNTNATIWEGLIYLQQCWFQVSVQ